MDLHPAYWRQVRRKAREGTPPSRLVAILMEQLLSGPEPGQHGNNQANTSQEDKACE